MDLEHHPGAESAFLQARRHANHGKLYYIGRCPLDGGVDGIAFGQGPHRGVVRMDVREVPASAEESLNIAVLPGKGHGRINETADGRERGEIVVNEAFGSATGKPQPLGQAEGRNPVHDAEVGGFGLSSFLPCHLRNRFPENLGGGGGVDVHTLPECSAEVLVST